MASLLPATKLELIIWFYIRTVYERKSTSKEVPDDIKFLIKQFAKYTIGSSILSNEHEIAFLNKLSSMKKMSDIHEREFKLLYRASDHEYSAERFHKLCDGHSPTFVIVHNNYGNIFGGYTTVPWKSAGGFQEDNDAFLFVIESNDKKIDTPKIYEMHPSGGWSVSFNGKEGPLFGGGYSIRISDKCNEFDVNSPQIDQDADIDEYLISYSYETGEEYHENELCGSNLKISARYLYQVLEYEVFELV